MMKAVLPIALALGALAPAPALAAPDAAAATTLGAPVPTTHVLAIGLLTGDRTAQSVKDIMPAEVKATVGLYLAGHLDQWWVQKDKQGVVFLLNAASTAEAQALLADLPLVKAGLMRFDLTALGPLRPLQYLTDDGARK